MKMIEVTGLAIAPQTRANTKCRVAIKRLMGRKTNKLTRMLFSAEKQQRLKLVSLQILTAIMIVIIKGLIIMRKRNNNHHLILCLKESGT